MDGRRIVSLISDNNGCRSSVGPHGHRELHDFAKAESRRPGWIPEGRTICCAGAREGPCTILKYQCLKETKVGEETKVSRRSPATCCCCCAEWEALSRVPDPPSSPPSPESLYILFLLLAFSHNQSTRQKRSRHRLFTLSK
jgi:hypothetical protein